MKPLITLLALLFLISSYTEAKDYVVVGISGFGTRRPENAWQPSGAHENLPDYGNIFARHELVHYAKKRELQEIIDYFNCKDGLKGRQDLGLLILVNSWGSGKAHKLAKMYNKQCGELVDSFYIVDGVSKPIGAFKREVPAKECRNYYQTKGLVRGTDIPGCENHDLTKQCDITGHSGGVECHIFVEWRGSKVARDHMLRNFLNTY
jgi:hypothetical protein